MTDEEWRREQERRTIAIGVHRTPPRDKLIRGIERSRSTVAARKVADETIGSRRMSIEDFRRMAREECFHPLEEVARRKGGKTKHWAEYIAASIEKGAAATSADEEFDFDDLEGGEERESGRLVRGGAGGPGEEFAP